MSSKEKISVQDQSKERKTLDTIAVGEEETSSASEGEETPSSNGGWWTYQVGCGLPWSTGEVNPADANVLLPPTEAKTVPPTDNSTVNGVSVTPVSPLSPTSTGQKVRLALSASTQLLGCWEVRRESR